MTLRREDIPFPCDRVPEDANLARLVGLYSQRQEGLWMQRIKVLGGQLTAGQWRALADLARALTPGTPLHLTTRQDIEIHDLPDEQVPVAQRRIAEMGLTSVGACGDTLRNITVCPCSGIRDGTVDLRPLAWSVRRFLEQQEGIFSLPRKFKISLSACEAACGRPWVNCLGLVARRREGRWGFFVTAGGSLGSRPATGIALFEHLAPGDVRALVWGAIQVFAAHGDRTNRRRARLRHVRERIGDETFREVMLEAFARARGEVGAEPTELPEAAGDFAEPLTLTFANGDVTPEAADALAELAGRHDVRVRIASHHRVAVFFRRGAQPGDPSAAMPALARAARPQAAVVACPGSRWCSRALVDTNAVADRIRREVGARLSPGTTVCISGCPNGCAHSGVAEIGLRGAVAKQNGHRREAFDVLVGGGGGRSNKLAHLVARKLLPEQAIATVAEHAAKD